jgi:ribosomal protein L12E/L44/L45/RPP1/RPP2
MYAAPTERRSSRSKALGDKSVREVTEVKKRVMSAAARAKISKATKAGGQNSERKLRRQWESPE